MQEKLPITLPANKAAYFASDFHLGISGKQTSIDRERQIVRWLDQIKEDAGAIFLVGDLFDFWFEYHSVIPKGYTRFLGKLAELRDHHIPIYIFTGNHDMWIFSYFEEELGIPTYREPIRIRINDKQFMIGQEVQQNTTIPLVANAVNTRKFRPRALWAKLQIIRSARAVGRNNRLSRGIIVDLYRGKQKLLLKRG